MYKSLKNDIAKLKQQVTASIVDNDPQIVFVNVREDKTYLIDERYYNPKDPTNTSKRKTFITDDYKKVLNSYTTNKTRAIIVDLIE